MTRLLICIFFNLAISAYPQSIAYPQGYFRNPLNIPISLSGNFGELRPNHFHMGLDIRTNKKENLPVYAAADGYIARVKIEPGGFGRAIYIDHPNGYTTLYAHLNRFNPKLENYIKQRQYAMESWSIFIEIPGGLFPVKKGDFLAFSGNTGGSQAPHLHFEIRRTTDDVNLNPLLFGFSLKDNVKPRIAGLAIYDRTRSVYEQLPRMFSLKKGVGGYTTDNPIITLSSPRISFAIRAGDAYTGSSNPNGIFSATLKENDEEIISFVMNEISYNVTRTLNAHIDYRLKMLGGPYFQHLSELPGNQQTIYHMMKGNGVLDISDEQVHEISISVKDAIGNTSILHVKLKYVHLEVQPAGINGKIFFPLMIDGFETAACEFFIGEHCLYDSVHIRYATLPRSIPEAISDQHIIGSSTIPLNEPMLVRILPSIVPQKDILDKIVMQWFSEGKKDVQKPLWQNGWANARFREFGIFQLLVDTVPPQIVPVGFSNGSNLSNATRIVFTIKDNLGKFKNVRTMLDGNWLRFTNDKGRNFIYAFDEKCTRGMHELMIHAEDEAGNVTEKTFTFNR